MALVVTASGGSASTSQYASGAGEMAHTADSFVDSVGVDTHFSYLNTPYVHFPTLLVRLRELGVRHIRDGLQVGRPALLRKYEALAHAGIHATLVMGAPGTGRAAPPFGQVGPLERTLSGAVRASVEAVEGANEWDLNGGVSWAAADLAWQRMIFRAVRSRAATQNLEVLAPSVGRSDPSGYRALGNLTAVSQAGNIHDYPGGVPMTPGILAAFGRFESLTNPGQPIIATETGYSESPSAADQPRGNPAVSPRVAARLLPGLLLDSYADGIRRTFVYELVDEADNPRSYEDNFGLLTAGLEPTPAFDAIRHLMDLLGDPGPRFAPSRLEVQLLRPDPSTHLLVFERRTRVFEVVVWSDDLFVKTGRSRLGPVKPRPVQLEIDAPLAGLREAYPGHSATLSPVSLLPGSRLSIDLSRGPVVVAFHLQQ